MNIRSLQRLDKVHFKLRDLMLEAAKKCPVDIEISEGLRTESRQRALLEAGASHTLRSRHLTGHAVDIFVTIDGKARWDWPLYTKAAGHIKATAERMGIPIIWGGDWKTFKDGPHFELSRKAYP